MNTAIFLTASSLEQGRRGQREAPSLPPSSSLPQEKKGQW